MQSKCSRFKVSGTGIEIDSDTVPVAVESTAAFVNRWFYENFPLVKGQSCECRYDDVISDNPRFSVTVYNQIEGEERMPIFKATFENL